MFDRFPGKTFLFDGFNFFSNIAALGSSMQFCVRWWHQGKGQRDQQ